MQHLLIAGLGNPGKEYDLTRHNVGFAFVDFLTKTLPFPQYTTKFNCLVSNSQVDSFKVSLLKPQTFMNNSGYPLSQFINFYKANIQNLIVIHDDLDLPIGKIKVKIDGGTGGHNGLKSIDQQLGKKYYRLRIGIGKPDKANVSNYVLNKFSKQEQNVIDDLFKSIIDNLTLLLNKDISKFCNNINMENKNNGF